MNEILVEWYRTNDTTCVTKKERHSPEEQVEIETNKQVNMEVKILSVK
tara:strand:- start:189 stop:332 length:144 start_codon:yes stop_codon:yes gene_type:complete